MILYLDVTAAGEQIRIIRTSREKYYCQDCLNMYDLCHS